MYLVGVRKWKELIVPHAFDFKEQSYALCSVTDHNPALALARVVGVCTVK